MNFVAQTPMRARTIAGLAGDSALPLADLAQSVIHLRAISRPDTYIELRARVGDKWRKQFFDSPVEAANLAQQAKDLADIYVGVLPRTHAGYGGDALSEHANVVWCEADTEAASTRVLGFAPAPPLIVRSSPGRLHAYWFLDRYIPLDFIERANKRLAYHLGCDPRATNAGRILRVAGTLNWKRGEPQMVALVGYETTPNISAAALVGDLPDPAPARALAPPARPPMPPDADTDYLRTIPARVYIERLSGREVLHGMVQCPFHAGGQERTPSCSVGGPADELFLCFGCDTGGDIFRFASLLWGMDERTQFPALKTKLKEML